MCNFGDGGGLWCSTTYLEIAHATVGVSGVGLVKPIFECVILGDSGGGLWCSTPYLEIAHATVGVRGVGLVKPIFVCVILVFS